jgi:hypothetical protein
VVDEAVHADVLDWIDEVPEAYLECRDYMHARFPWRAWWDSDAHAYREVLRCRRCTSQWSRLVYSTGKRSRWSVDYVDGYLRPAGSGRMQEADRDAMALRVTERLAEKTASKSGKKVV